MRCNTFCLFLFLLCRVLLILVCSYCQKFRYMFRIIYFFLALKKGNPYCIWSSYSMILKPCISNKNLHLCLQVVNFPSIRASTMAHLLTVLVDRWPKRRSHRQPICQCSVQRRVPKWTTAWTPRATSRTPAPVAVVCRHHGQHHISPAQTWCAFTCRMRRPRRRRFLTRMTYRVRCRAP